jgi:hypothetical protein
MDFPLTALIVAHGHKRGRIGPTLAGKSTTGIGGNQGMLR